MSSGTSCEPVAIGVGLDTAVRADATEVFTLPSRRRHPPSLGMRIPMHNPFCSALQFVIGSASFFECHAGIPDGVAR